MDLINWTIEHTEHLNGQTIILGKRDDSCDRYLGWLGHKMSAFITEMEWPKDDSTIVKIMKYSFPDEDECVVIEHDKIYLIQVFYGETYVNSTNNKSSTNTVLYATEQLKFSPIRSSPVFELDETKFNHSENCGSFPVPMKVWQTVTGMIYALV